MSNYPILRLAIPLSAGIFFAGAFRPDIPLWGVTVGLVCLIVLGGVFFFCQSHRHRWWFGVSVFLLFFLVGVFRMLQRSIEVEVDWPQGRHGYVARVMEPPIEKPKSIWCKTMFSDGQNVYLYLAKDSFARRVSMGDRLILHAQIRKPDNEGLTFDYASYLFHKGVSGTAYVPAGHWDWLERNASLSLKQKALLVRQKMVGKYREWGIGEEQLPVLAALTVGHKADLSDEMREAYSVAGISHVLALSGMHIGFIWLMLSVFLKPMDRKGLHWIKWMVATIVLWAFAFVAGLEASVVRAVIMCMLMELGLVLENRPLSLNTLAIAAFFMLLYNPSYLFEVSFQLSFLAVLSILMFYSRILAWCPSRLPFVRGVWNVMSVSVAAQLGAAPLIMYCFSNFSVYFLLANLAVALWVPCIIYTAFASMALVFLPWLHRWLVVALDKMVETLNAFAVWISSLPHASLAVVSMHQVEVWILYILIGVVWWYVVTRQRKAFITLLAVIALWLALHCCLVLK